MEIDSFILLDSAGTSNQKSTPQQATGGWVDRFGSSGLSVCVGALAPYSYGLPLAGATRRVWRIGVNVGLKPDLRKTLRHRWRGIDPKRSKQLGTPGGFYDYIWFEIGPKFIPIEIRRSPLLLTLTECRTSGAKNTNIPGCGLSTVRLCLSTMTNSPDSSGTRT